MMGDSDRGGSSREPQPRNLNHDHQNQNQGQRHLRETPILEDDGGGGGEELALLGETASVRGPAKVIQSANKAARSRSPPNGRGGRAPTASPEEIRISITGTDGQRNGGAKGPSSPPPPPPSGLDIRPMAATPTPEVYTTTPSTPNPLDHDHFDHDDGGFSWNVNAGQEPAVVVEQGYKNYGPVRILSDFNMCVHQNTIYGLLGASGCGKTTILSGIVAIRRLDAGCIRIHGWPTGSLESGIPGKRVGYMPQEIALNGEFRVKEVLQYFGRIYGMSQAKVTERYEYIVNLLSLEKCKTNLIRNLSDGQKRRVSMAVAMLHEPEILILDEPTVGCDPLLRENIWKFLTELVAQRKTTVIVTTHYIEETRQADRVGLMRNGRLLVEDSPTQLLLLYNATLLDDIVLQLCHKDEMAEARAGNTEETRQLERRRSSKLGAIVFPKKDFPPSAVAKARGPQVPTCNSCHKKMIAETKNAHRTTMGDRMRALVVKNVIVLYRNLMFLLFLILLPTITVLVFCLCVGSEPLDLRVGVINNELLALTSESNGTGTVSSSSNAWLTMRDIICQPPSPMECENKNLSCLFLDSINKQQIKLVPFRNVEDALEEVRLTKLWGYITFESDFSQHIFKRLMLGKSNNETIWGSQIRVWLDMSNKGVGLTLKKQFFDAFRDFTTRLLVACSINPVGRDIPVTFETPVYGTNDNDDMIDFMAPGISLGMVFFMGALTCGLTYIIEKKDGMINRTLVTGVSTVEIMLSHFMTQFVVIVAQVVVVLVILLLAFGLKCEGSVVLAFVIILLSSVSGMSLGFLAATFCNEEKNAMLVAMGTVFPSFLLAGLIWPIESAPRAVQYISFLFPGTLIAEAFRSVMLRGFGLDHHVVWEGFIAGFAWIGVYWFITVVWHRLQKKL